MKDLTLWEAYQQASSFFKAKQIGQDPERTAKWLLEHVTGITANQLPLYWQDTFPENKLEQWQACLIRKGKGEPIQYIIGQQEFYGFTFQVNPHVLIPRPETELLVESVLKLADGSFKGQNPVIVDIGTGSGAIPITIARKCPDWNRIIATDISLQALETARQNATYHRVTRQVQFIQGDLLQPFLHSDFDPIDILISNPPYIPSSDIALLHAEVKNFEPLQALDGGADGLAIYRKLFIQLEQLTPQPSWVGLEVGAGQAEIVAEMLEQMQRWDRVEIIRDYAGIQRHVIAKMIDS